MAEFGGSTVTGDSQREGRGFPEGGYFQAKPRRNCLSGALAPPGVMPITRSGSDEAAQSHSARNSARLHPVAASAPRNDRSNISRRAFPRFPGAPQAAA